VAYVYRDVNEVVVENINVVSFWTVSKVVVKNDNVVSF
jgi:hypothetical protein